MSKRKPLTRREQREVDILLTGNHVYGQCWAARTLFREVVRLRASLAAAEDRALTTEEYQRAEQEWRRQIARANAACAAAEEKLADERKHATQVATVLCDRIHANTIYIGAVAGLNDFHEDATACISHNMEAINATRDLAGCDRSHERWEVEAQARLREIIAESERRAREACAEADADSAARRQEASDERP